MRSISETIRDKTNLSWDEMEDAEVGEEMHRQEILGSVGELRMFEGAKPFLLDLLHLICQKYPPNAI